MGAVGVPFGRHVQRAVVPEHAHTPILQHVPGLGVEGEHELSAVLPPPHPHPILGPGMAGSLFGRLSLG